MMQLWQHFPHCHVFVCIAGRIYRICIILPFKIVRIYGMNPRINDWRHRKFSGVFMVQRIAKWDTNGRSKMQKKDRKRKRHKTFCISGRHIQLSCKLWVSLSAHFRIFESISEQHRKCICCVARSIKCCWWVPFILVLMYVFKKFSDISTSVDKLEWPPSLPTNSVRCSILPPIECNVGSWLTQLLSQAIMPWAMLCVPRTLMTTRSAIKCECRVDGSTLIYGWREMVEMEKMLEWRTNEKNEGKLSRQVESAGSGGADQDRKSCGKGIMKKRWSSDGGNNKSRFMSWTAAPCDVLWRATCDGNQEKMKT